MLACSVIIGSNKLAISMNDMDNGTLLIWVNQPHRSWGRDAER